MIPRTLYIQVGGLDERYQVGLFEDDDLAMKLKQNGFDLLCAEDVFIHHVHQASFKKLGSNSYQALF